MHRQFRDLIGSAKGESKPVIALNIDVRGFSKFSLEVESVDTALYIRKIYKAILGKYFPKADFFKPTGDGLLVVIDIDEGNNRDLVAKSNRVVKTSIKLVEDFGGLLDGDPWIYFKMPEKIGIGIARGAASRLVADDITLDYSGTVLNLASRLMDLARPSGIVIDESFPFSVLADDLQEPFKSDDKVYVRSVAEKFPRCVYYRQDWTEISPSNRRPLDEIKWKEIKDSFTLAELESRGPRFIFDLEAEPIDALHILVRVEYPSSRPKGGKMTEIVTELDAEPNEIDYQQEAGEPRLSVRFDSLAKRLVQKGVKSTWPLRLRVKYPT